MVILSTLLTVCRVTLVFSRSLKSASSRSFRIRVGLISILALVSISNLMILQVTHYHRLVVKDKVGRKCVPLILPVEIC